MLVLSDSFIAHWLFEDPLPIVVTCSLVALILVYVGLQRRQTKKQHIGLGLAGVALLAWLISWSVETPREKLILRCQALVQATAPLDTPQLRDLLAPTCQVTGPDGSVLLPPGRATQTLIRYIKQLQVQSQRIRLLAASVESTSAGTTELAVRTSLGARGQNGSYRTDWHLTWQVDPGKQWRITGMQWLKFNGQKAPANMLK